MPDATDLARILALYGVRNLDADDLLTPATAGQGVVYPDHQTRSVQVYLEDVPAGFGGQDVPPLSGADPPGYDTYYEPPVAWLWWVNNGQLIRRDGVRFTQQIFTVPMWAPENVLIWRCLGSTKMGIWRYYDSSAPAPS